MTITRQRLAAAILAAFLFVLPGCRVQDGSEGLDLEASYVLNQGQGDELSGLLQSRADERIGLCPESDRFSQRLARLADPHTAEDGLRLSFAVYATGEAMADILPDGSVRFSAGFLSMFTDSEMRFIIGHLIGQMASGDSLRALGSVYAARNLTGVPFYTLTGEQKDALLAAYSRYGFSRQQEEAADDYAFRFMQRHGFDLLAAVSALQKLDRLDRNISFVSSHVESGSRAARIQSMVGG